MAKFFLLDPSYANASSNFYVGRGRSAYDVRGNRQRIQEDVNHPDNEVTIDLLQVWPVLEPRDPRLLLEGTW